MPNQPVLYSRRSRSSGGSSVAALLVALLAGGVLIGTIAMLAVGMGAFRPAGSATPGQATTSAIGSPTAAPSAGPDGSAPATPRVTPPVASPTTPVTGTLDPPPKAGPFSMELYRKGAFVSELKPINCVPAAMQTMINIMSSGPTDRTIATQKSLYRLARRLSGRNLVGAGAEPEGWAAGLNQLGFGPYEVAVEPTRMAAVTAAARALRMTGRPVGLLTWKGAHSWVVSGFKATADPAWTDRFQVTGLYVEDVWYPRISSIWGPSLPPDSFDPMGDLHIDYLPWRRPTHRYPDKDGKFVLVLPAES